MVRDWDALQPGLRQAIQSDMASAWFMYAVLVILVAFSVLNTQLMSVLERTREFGIVMALGLKPGRLGRLVMLETALMGFVGLVLGDRADSAVVRHGAHRAEISATFSTIGPSNCVIKSSDPEAL